LVDADDDARTIGRRVRQIRHSRRKSLVVIAGLAGMSKSESPASNAANPPWTADPRPWPWPTLSK
jgi:hypothetical protein